MKTVSAIIFSIFFASHLLAGTIDPNVSDQKYIEYGAKFTNVVQICGTYENKSLFCASAVVISPTRILTAAHVVKDAAQCYITIDNKKYCINKIICHKDFNDNEFGMNDIAIGYSEKKIDLPFYPELYEKTDEVDKVCSIAGFGLTGTFKTGAIKSDNNRRAGSNIIDKIDRHLLMCSPSPGKYRKTELEFLIASGDSGGGLFIDGKLAGINSCVIVDGQNAPKSDYATEAGHTRISQHIEWIKANLNNKE